MENLYISNNKHFAKAVNNPLSIPNNNVKYEEKILETRRVTKVVKGGKKLTFRVLIAVGDMKGKVGIGIGRAETVNLAIEKASLQAKKFLIRIPLTYKYSIPQIMFSSYSSATILLKPAGLGSGIIAGGSIRTVLELAGIRNVVAKQLGAKSFLNNAKATIKALSYLNTKIEQDTKHSYLKSKYYSRILKT